MASKIEEWNSETTPQTRPYLIINNLVKFYNKINDANIINLYQIDQTFNHFSWFFNKKDNMVYNFNLIIDDYPYQKIKDVKEILENLKVTTYIKIDFYLKSIKRSELSNKNVIHTINICIDNQLPEHFKLVDIKKEEIPININVGLKRKRADSSEANRQNKKRKIDSDINWREMISASSTRNYFLNDPLIDYITEYNITSIENKPSKRGNSSGCLSYELEDPFTKFIMDEGIKFEKEVMKVLFQKHKIVQVTESYQSRNQEMFQKTVDLMKQGVPIIYQGILHDYKNKTFGAPDLLVRSDYLNKLVINHGYNDDQPSIKLGVDWHYVVVDIKHSTIPLRADGIHILNSDSMPAYKGQLLVYTQALNEILGCNITQAFIMGKKYVFEKCGTKYEINQLFDKLGTIDYNGVDSEYVKQLSDAVTWLRLLRKEGHNWKLLPLPSRQELFPNMKNDRDGVVGKIKKELSQKIYEITSVYYCGVDKRHTAHKQGIYGWNDEKCCSETLGFKPGKIADRVDAILETNRNENQIFSPKKIKCNSLEWRNRKSNEMEFFVDYETMNSNFGTINVSGVGYEEINFVFMIGVGFHNKNNEWEFKCFIAKNKTVQGEKEMIDEFWNFIKNKMKEYKKTQSVFIHWSPAEKTAYEKLKQRHKNLPDKKLVDLYQVFIEEPITVKGALNFSLKSINKAMYENNLIKSTWKSDNPCMNGMSAMLLAHQIYQSNTPVEDSIIMKDIESYNEIDCKSMYEIITYLRNNH